MNLQSTTAAITTSELADLCAVTPAAIRHHAELPRTPVHSAAPGRPEHAIELAALAQFAFDQTAHLSEAEVRLRLALAGRTEAPRARNVKRRPHRLVDNDEGGYTAVPLRTPDDYDLDQQADLRQAVRQKEPRP
jgi:hypothetical protein